MSYLNEEQSRLTKLENRITAFLEHDHSTELRLNEILKRLEYLEEIVRSHSLELTDIDTRLSDIKDDIEYLWKRNCSYD